LQEASGCTCSDNQIASNTSILCPFSLAIQSKCSGVPVGADNYEAAAEAGQKVIVRAADLVVR